MNRTRLLSATVGALLLIVPAGGALAQTPEPVERTPEMEARAAELTALFPAELAGVSLLDDLDVDIGQEMIAERDPSDPDDAQDIETIHGLMEAAGATLDDAATAAAFFALDEEAFGFLFLYQILGSDARETLPTFVEAFQEDIPDAVAEPGQVGDVEVTFLHTDEDAEGDVIMLLTRGDITWVVGVPMQYLEEVVGSLPES